MEQTDFKDLAEMLQNPKVMYAYEHDFSDEDEKATGMIRREAIKNYEVE